MWRLACALAAVWVVSVGRASTFEARDDRGHTLRLAQPAARIVALAPHLTEIAFAAGVGGKLIAVSAYSDYPPAARRLPQVGDGARVDIERILTLKPDLVLAWRSGNQVGDIARLERLNIPVWLTEPSRLTDIARLLRGVAKLAGAAQSGERAAAQFENELQGLRHDSAGLGPPPRVFYEIWREPLITVSRDHLISDAIRWCGGVNVFETVATLTPSVTYEAVLAARPQLVLGGASAGGEAAFLASWRNVPLTGLRELPARFVAPHAIQRASPRITGGVRAICEAIAQVRRPA